MRQSTRRLPQQLSGQVRKDLLVYHHEGLPPESQVGLT